MPIECDTLTVEELPEVKAKVSELYKKANEETWSGQWVIYSHEACMMPEWTEVVEGPALFYSGECADIPTGQRNFVEGLGFEFKEIAHVKYTNGSRTSRHCHVQYNRRELTTDELWLTDIKQRAIDLGYDIRDCVGYEECCIGWGFWGATSSEAWNAIDNFVSETKITPFSQSLIRNFQGGYLVVFKSFYVYGLYNITL